MEFFVTESIIIKRAAYSIEDVLKFAGEEPICKSKKVQNFIEHFDGEKQQKFFRQRYGRKEMSSKEELEEFFKMERYQKMDYLFHEWKIPIFSLEFDDLSDGIIVSKNRRLKDFEFYRLFEPTKAFQEVSMFIGGVLGSEGPGIVKITDNIVLRDKAGFDKTSFKNISPGERKERRRNKKD
jgi:hypothetical protein